MEKKIIHNVSWSVFWKGAGVVAVIVLAYIVRDALIALFFSLILSSALGPPVNALQRRGVPRILAVILIFLILVTLIGAVLYIAMPSIIAELSDLIKNIDELTPHLQVYLSPEVVEEIRRTLFESAAAILQSTASIFGFLSTVLGGIATLLATAVITFYILINEHGVSNFIRVLSPPEYEDYFIRLWVRVKHKLGRWLQAQMLLSIFVGTTTYAAVALLGVPFAGIIGIIAAVFEIVPIVGPIFAGAIAIIFAFTQSPQLALFTLIAFIIIQQIESQVLVPILTKKMVGVNPVIVLVSIMAGFAIGGIVGMLLSIPVVVVLQEILEDRSERKRAMPEKAGEAGG